jgi:AcrR family transcriptional regulator
MGKSSDLRVIKTKQLLKEALLALLTEMEFEEITIMKLTTYAQINRSTFYAHFYDKYDLLERTINDELFTFAEEVAPKSEEELMAVHIPKSLYLRATQYIYQREEFFKIMMGKNGIPSFQQQFLEIIKRYMGNYLERYHPQPDEMGIPREFLISYVAHAYVGVISYWLQSGTQYSPQYVAEKLASMTVRGPLSIAGLK